MQPHQDARAVRYEDERVDPAELIDRARVREENSRAPWVVSDPIDGTVVARLGLWEVQVYVGGKPFDGDTLALGSYGHKWRPGPIETAADCDAFEDAYLAIARKLGSGPR